MLAIWGIVLVALGLVIGVFAPRLLPKFLSAKGLAFNALGIGLVAFGAGVQVYDAWWKLPPQCRSVLAVSCPAPVQTAAQGKRR